MCGNAYQDRFHEVSGCPLYKEERERDVSISELGRLQGCVRGAIEMTGLQDEGGDNGDIREQKVARTGEVRGR